MPAMDQDTTDRTSPLLGRRRALALFGGAGLAVLAGCGSGGDTDAAASSSSSSSSSGSSSSAVLEETAGPYPGDGSNGPDVLSQDGVVRSDIRSSFGSASGVAEGVPLTVDLTVLDGASGSPLSGGAVYIWHCDRDGQYSMYGQRVTARSRQPSPRTNAIPRPCCADRSCVTCGIPTFPAASAICTPRR